MRRWNASRSWGPVLIGSSLLVLLLLLNFSRIMERGLDHDEHQFVTSGVLLARDGLLPYKDYAYFHVPLLVFVYALLFQETSYYLLAARSFSALCSGLLLVSLFLFGYRLFAGHNPKRALIVAGSATLLVATAPIFIYTSGRAWNHDLPILLAVLALLAHVRGLASARSLRWIGLSGLLVGLASATRLSLAPLFLPLVVAIWLWPGESKTNQRLRALVVFCAAAVVGGLPALVFLWDDPVAFLFGNFEYARLNTRYREAIGYDQRMTIPTKLAAFGWNNLILEPGNLLIVVAYVGLGLPCRRLSPPVRAWQVLLAGVLLALAVGALAPTPAWPQYYYVLFPFLGLGALYGLRHAHPTLLDRRWFQWTGVAALLLGLALTSREYQHLSNLVQPNQWTPIQFHTTGQQVAALAGPDARILTLASALPLEGGAMIYPELATGPFALRAGSFISETAGQPLHLVDPARLESWLADQPPHAIVTGSYRGHAIDEEPLVAYAQQHGYTPLSLEDETLWLPGRAQWDDAIRLVTVTGVPKQVMAGATITPVLLLENIARLDENLNVTVRAVGQQGKTVVQSEGWPWGRPTSTWQLHEIWYDGHTLHLPADTQPGLYRIEVEFYSAAQEQILPVTALGTPAPQETPYVADYFLVGERPPPPGQVLEPPPQFENLAILAGFDLAPPALAQGDETIHVRLHWRPLGSLARNYTTFVHLVSPAGELVAQHDKQPLDGFYPTTRWQTTQPFADDFELTPATTLPPGTYSLYAGFYDLDSGARLSVFPTTERRRLLTTVGERLFQADAEQPSPTRSDAWLLTSITVGSQ